MQIGEHNQYIVRIDGSRRLTLRNRRFLRKMSSPKSVHPMQWGPLSSQPTQSLVPQSSKVEAQLPQDPSTPQPHAMQSPQTPAVVQPSRRASLKAQTSPVSSAPQAPDSPPVSENSQKSPATGHSPLAVPPVEMPMAPTTHAITVPSLQQPALQSPQVSQQLLDKRAPGRPCKKRIFNFMVPKTSVTQSPQTQQVTPPPGNPTGSAQLPRRSQRAGKKPDWYGER